MAALNAKSICRNYSLAEIETKITFYTEQLDAATVRSYSKDSSQGSQRVESSSLKDIESLLQVWLKAKECLTGVGGVQVVSGNFQDRRRGGII